MSGRIGIIGSGKVGCSAASFLLSEADEILLYDIVPNLPVGEALDLQNAVEALGLNTRVKGVNDLSHMHGLDVVVVTAGFGRTAGMSRMDLLKKNLPIVENIALEYGKGLDEKTVFVIVSNPVDVLTYVFWKRSRVDKQRIAGLSGLLDSSRLKTLMKLHMNKRIEGLGSFVLGEHGENMVILKDRLREEYGLNDDDLEWLQRETVKAAANIIGFKGATVYGPAAAVARMIKAVLSDSGEVLPASAILEGEYGIKDVCIGVPVEARRNGFKVFEEKLSENELKMLRKASESLIIVLEQIGYRG
ncbi:MAG: lactate/malate family dehydrogenase [Thermoproteota archaeon]